MLFALHSFVTFSVLISADLLFKTSVRFLINVWTFFLFQPYDATELILSGLQILFIKMESLSFMMVIISPQLPDQFQGLYALNRVLLLVSICHSKSLTVRSTASWNWSSVYFRWIDLNFNRLYWIKVKRTARKKNGNVVQINSSVFRTPV